MFGINARRKSQIWKEVFLLFICIRMLQGGIVIAASVSDGDAIVSGGDITVSGGDLFEEIPEEVKAVSDDGTQEVIKVLLPTDFAVLLYHDTETGQLKMESQDILIINKSEVPVDVEIENIIYEVQGEGTAQTLVHNSLTVLVNEYGKEERITEYGPELFAPFTIRLKESAEEKNEQELLEEAEEWTPMGAVRSDDYCSIRVKGELEQEELPEEALKVSIVFAFKNSDTQ